MQPRVESRESEEDYLTYKPSEFRIPAFFNVFEGQYEHQGRAVKSWEDNGNKGILAMATGSGKTISALVAAHRLLKNVGQLIIVISVPTRPLVTQWKTECQEFGLNPIAGPEIPKSKRLKLVQNAIDNVEFNVTDVETIITTNDGIMDADFQRILSSTTRNILFIADEVHNLGGNRKFISDPPNWGTARLGLSATPVRQYDEDGTQSLIEYFGDVVFEFSLDEAIGVCLVPYDYYLHSVNLSFEECERYAALSEKIRRKVARAGGEVDRPDSSLTVLLNQRRLVLETATSKINLLSELIDGIGPENIKRSLFYTTDKDPKQLELVNSLLTQRGIRWHQITEEETSNGHLLARVMTSFSDGTVGALTAKRVLDEGLNVPQIDTAFILASTTIEKQWIQRRGRVLRPSKSTGKTHATIHDFLVLPPPEYGFDDETRNLVKSELVRCEEFARLSRNRASFGGPYAIINEVRFRYLVEN
ncbi:DEAD/DEAH box helicase [Acidithrix ferrooxidans]|uniref:Type III restriction enzyme, res subunit n=1 Tax=Acidithrix ferrooxidans TaxID=1280514 RepID=A0A0D8HE44_9ACTN|nr:DEAD/DEAH box helicase family protein [Acidithrix ferrooxidans]KJF16154.1 type III restriction enzyme, res subunit [Acidithrix ferrooxidans]